MFDLTQMFGCPKCAAKFGWAAKLEKHIRSEHQLDPEELYTEVNLSGEKPKCGCGCDSPIPWNGWKLGYSSKFLRGHNAVVQRSFADPSIAAKAAKTRAENYREGKSKTWNDGLTKESDPRIAAAAQKASCSLRERYDSGTLVPWQTGFSADTHPSVGKIAESRKQGFLDGTIRNWTEGLTKDTDERLARVAAKISQTKSSRKDTHRRAATERILESIHRSGFEITSDVNDYRKRRVQRLTVRCLVCNTEQQKSLAMIEESPVCFICHPRSSLPQRQIAEYVRSLGFDASESDRTIITPKEIDVYVPARNLGIELNGLFYHCEASNKHPLYHEEKTESCKQAGVRLFHIFEDEWRDKREIVESMIASRLAASSRRIYARKCSISELDVDVRRRFFDRTHIDGDARATVAWGLFFGEELVSALSLRKPVQRSRRDNTYELARFSCELHTSVVGGLSKLVKTSLQWLAERNVAKLMTYVDKRHGDGHGYENIGFRLAGETASPRFWWTGGDAGPNQVDRLVYKADLSTGRSEKQVAEDAGVSRIYGCRNKIYLLDVV